MEEPFNADAWVGPQTGVWKTEGGEFLRMHHMSRPYLIKVIQFIRARDPFYEHSRVYNALRRELKKRQHGEDK